MLGRGNWIKVFLIFSQILNSFETEGALFYTSNLTLYRDEKWQDYKASIISEIIEFINDNLQIGIDIYNIIEGPSSDCKSAVLEFLVGVVTKKQWAWQMIDASSKVPSGILDGNFQDLGDFDECIRVDADGDFRGQYCLVRIFNGSLRYISKRDENKLHIGPTVAFCIPSSCQGEDFQNVLNAVLNKVNITGQVLEDSCTKDESEPFQVLDFVSISILILAAVFVLFSTIYDVNIYRAQETGNRSDTLISFSLCTNMENLTNKRQPAGTITCIHGLKFLSIAWIILGHRYLLNLIVPLMNLRDVALFLEAWQSSIIFNAVLAVDVFLLLSGLLISYNFLRRDTSQECAIKFTLGMYIHRYIRLTPLYAFIILLQLSAYPRFGDGPLWNVINRKFTRFCEKNWWLNLIYFNNYVNKDEMCLIQSWYLSVDTQLFLLAPLLLYPIQKLKKKGIYLILLFLLMETGLIFLISYYYELRAGPVATMDNRTMKTLDLLYMYTHTRAAPWLIGLGLGSIFAFHQIPQRSYMIPRIVVLIGWILSLAICIGTIFSISYFKTDQPYQPIIESLYLSLHRTIWALGISWIILACSTGNGGFINSFLSNRLFQALGKLTFCMYLTHFNIIFLQVGRERTTQYFSTFFQVYRFLGDMFIITVVSLIFYLFIECPIVSLSRQMLKM